MRYMILLYGDEALSAEVTEEDWQNIIEAHNAFGAEAAERGMNPSGEALQSVQTARTIRFEDGKSVMVTDGPFAETKEQLGGFYLLDCESLEDAIEMAKKLPMSTGSIEVRPVVEFG
jgi:hypothetical protein